MNLDKYQILDILTLIAVAFLLSILLFINGCATLPLSSDDCKCRASCSCGKTNIIERTLNAN